MVGPDDQAHYVGGYQADEPDRSCDGDRYTRQECTDEEEDPFQAFDIHAEMGRVLLPERDDVDVARVKIDGRTPDRDEEGDEDIVP